MKQKHTQPRKAASRFILCIIILEILLGAIMYLKLGEQAKDYLFVLIPTIATSALLGIYVSLKERSMWLYLAVAMLANIALAYQMYVDLNYSFVTSTYSVAKHAIGIPIACVFIVFYRLTAKYLTKGWMAYGAPLICIAIYAALYLYGIDPNGYGTKAWISIKGYTFQLTDIAKIAAMFFYSALFARKKFNSDASLLWLSTIFFCLNLVGSVMIHELGSFFILFFLHIAILLMFMRNSKLKRNYMLTVFALCALGVGSSFLCYHLLKPYADAGALNTVTSIAWPIAKKVYERFSTAANITLDPYGAGYQLNQGKKAMWMAGLFGNQIHFNAIPVPESDMAFVALINSFGFVFGFIVLACFAIIMIVGSETSRVLYNYDKERSILVYASTMLLYLQGMIVILGSCNLIPFAGLPIPFLSRGGTYQTIVCCLCAIMFYESRVLSLPLKQERGYMNEQNTPNISGSY